MSREIEVARDVLQDNTQNAEANRQRFGREGVYVVIRSSSSSVP